MTSVLLNTPLSVKALEQDDEGAFELLLQSMLVVGTPASVFNRTPSVATGLNDVQTKTTVKVAKERAPVNLWIYKDSTEIKYNRIRLLDVAKKYLPVVYADFPTSKKALLSQYLTKNGFFDRSSDAVDGAVTAPGTATIAVIPASFLLTGQQAFTVKQAPKFLDDVVTSRQLVTFDATKHMNGAAFTVMVAAINAQNAARLPRPMTATEVKASVPRLVDEYDEFNTEVDILNSGSEVYLGKVTLTYHRVNFMWLLSGAQMVLSGPSAVTTQILLDKIRLKTGYTMEIDDLVVERYTPVPKGQMQTLTVTVAPTSLRYVGEITIDYTAV